MSANTDTLDTLVRQLADHVRSMAHPTELAYELRITGEGYAGVFTLFHPERGDRVNLKGESINPVP